MSAPPSEPALSALPPSAQPSSVPPSGPLRPLSHTEPHTPSHATTPARFSCCRCGFESHVDYHGRTPPFNRSVVFLEAVYLIRSPMGDASRPLCLGGTCVVWCATTTPPLSHHHAWHTLTSEPRLRAAPLAWRLMLTREGTEFLASDHLRMDIHCAHTDGTPRSPHACSPTRMLAHPHDSTGPRATHGVPARALSLRSERQVCAAAKRSLFYTKRICADCLSRPEIAAQIPSASAGAPASAAAASAAGGARPAAVPQPKR